MSQYGGLVIFSQLISGHQEDQVPSLSRCVVLQRRQGRGQPSQRLSLGQGQGRRSGQGRTDLREPRTLRRVSGRTSQAQDVPPS